MKARPEYRDDVSAVSEYMRAAGLGVLDTHVFITLVSLANDATLIVHDDLDSLARWCSMTAHAVERSLAALQSVGMISRATHDPCSCHASDWLLKVRPHDEWSRNRRRSIR